MKHQSPAIATTKSQLTLSSLLLLLLPPVTSTMSTLMWTTMAVIHVPQVATTTSNSNRNDTTTTASCPDTNVNSGQCGRLSAPWRWTAPAIASLLVIVWRRLPAPLLLSGRVGRVLLVSSRCSSSPWC